ncbi:MAG: hypothetical protein HC851_13715 [Acaryochloris sp. RU_4_1]|nr:hypothetical protein [Acaryochloris sp. RU_4_1]NJR55383.1 hypothetical protein [Acaryochloris sp. CRU_2_0]
MSNSAVTNLDRLAAQHAQAVIADTKDRKSSDVENTVTKALGVLQEDGVYACFLYLLAKEQASKEDKKKNKKSAGEILVKYMLDLLDSLKIGWDKPSSEKAEDILSHLTQNNKRENERISLEQLLLTKETLEQMLIYARYGAKARQDQEPENGQSDQEKKS